MSELKTLKEINFDCYRMELGDSEVKQILKQEAIKWIYEWTKSSIQYFKIHKKELKSFGVYIFRDGELHKIILTKEVIEYIKFYNNLLEEDLK